MIMQQKKEERAKGRRKKRNVDIINDNDDLIVDLLRRMREAAEVLKLSSLDGISAAERFFS